MNTPLHENSVSQIESCLQSLTTRPFSPVVRTRILYSQKNESIDFKKFGTYGFIKNCSCFIVLAVEKGPYALENAGFIGESIILELTKMGLGSCWLGGSFRRGQFSEAIGLTENELLPAVIAVGVPADKRSLVDRAIIWSAKSRTRLPLDTLCQNYDEKLLTAPMKELLLLMQAAPSASNKQPWRFICQNNRIHFYILPDAKYQRTLNVAKLVDLQRVDMGIILSHLTLAAEEMGAKAFISVQKPEGCEDCAWSYLFTVDLQNLPE